MAMKNILYTLANQSSKKTKEKNVLISSFVGISLYIYSEFLLSHNFGIFSSECENFVNKKQQSK